MPAMRSLLFPLLLAVVALLFLAPREAQAVEAPFYETYRDAREAASTPFDSRTDPPKGPVEDPADWIAVVGIACYAIIPVVMVVILGVVGYQIYLNNTDAALLSAHGAWAVRGSRPPQGLVLLRF
jgi:hypothetical protein